MLCKFIVYTKSLVTINFNVKRKTNHEKATFKSHSWRHHPDGHFKLLAFIYHVCQYVQCNML